MRKKKARMIAAVSAAALTAGMLPGMAAAADEPLADPVFEPTAGNVVWSEGFEDGNIKNIIEGGQRGFKIDGDNYSIDTGNGWGTGSNAVRFCNIEWGGNNSLTLDMLKSAQEQGNNALETALEGNVMISFKMQMDADYGGFWNGSTNTLILEDQNGRGFMGLEAYTKDNGSDDITLNLIALNDECNENIRYELAKGRNNVFKMLKEVSVYLDSETMKYQIRINGKTISAGNHGEWIPMSTSGEPGSASKADSVKAGRIRIQNKGSNWYGGIVIDDAAVSNWTKLEFAGEAEAPEKAMSMWYRRPAYEWKYSMPIGNGRIGAMTWGGIISDTVSLNEVTAWSGEDHTGKALDKDGSADGYAALNALREELKKESPNRTLVSQYLSEMGGTGNDAAGTHRPFGKLEFSFESTGEAIENYRRSLDLENAVTTVEYTSGGVKYTRQAFVSNPDQVLVLTYEADKNGKITFDTDFATENSNGGTGESTAYDDYLEWNGEVFNYDNVKNGVKTFGYMKAVNEGGTVTYDSNGLHVDGADKVTLIVSIGTDFSAGVGYEQNSKENAKAQLDAAAERSSELMDRHAADVAPLFNRMKVEIGPADELRSPDPMDVRLEKIREGGEIDGSFMSLWYQYARYLMIAGSRENSPMPMNLQGIWNDNVACNMAWTCDYHLDINIQMNQWMANSSNLSESEKPIFNFMKNILIPNGNITAKKQYNSPNGWLAGVATNAWGYTGISSSSWESFTGTTCGAWLAQEIMSYYDHTGDIEFLREDGYDMLRSTAAFYDEFMTEYTDKDGNTYWVTIPSASPEHGNVEMMSTMDITVISDIFTQVKRCYEILRMEQDDFYSRISDKLERLAPYRITDQGSLSEWPYRADKNDEYYGNTNHRHTSHLLGLFPYAQITPDKTPELAKAALISMQRRFDRSDFEHTEWTAVNAQGQYARLKDGENAYKYLKLQGDTFTWPNLLSISPEGIALAPCDVYIIDGTFGVGQATAEMLMQSHSGRIEFLPALPKQWSEGNIEGMSAEGAFEVDFTWKDYTISKASITSKKGNTANILKNAAVNWDNIAVFDSKGEKVTTGGDDKLLTFETEEGETYTLRTADGRELQTGRIINDNDSRIQYTGFNYHNDRSGRGDIGGDVHFSEHTGSAAELTFTGTGIDVLAEKDTDGKKAKVYIDGELKGEYSAYSETYEAQGVLCSIDGLDAGTHTVKVEQSEDGGFLVLDAFAVRGQYFSQINDDNPMITYGDGWGRSTGRSGKGNFMGDIHYGDENNIGSSITVDFSGTGIETIVEKDSIFGSLSFEVDGVSYGTADTSNGTGRYIVNPISGLSKGDHTLKITHLGGGGWNWCAVDGFIILDDAEGAALNSGLYELSGLSDGKILDDADGTPAVSNAMGGGDNQKWYLDYVDGRMFRIINAQSGMAASIGSDNRSLVQKPVDETASDQLWQQLPYTMGDGTVQIMNGKYAQFVQIDGGHTGNGGGVALWTYENADHTRWIMEEAGDGFVFIKNYVGTYLQVDSSSAMSEAAPIKTWEKLSGGSQVWKIEASGAGAFRITNNVTGMEIVSDNGTTALAEPSESEAGEWGVELRKSNGVAYYVFTNKQDGTALTVGGESGWKLSMKSASDTSPIAKNIEVGGSINAGSELSVSYDYQSVSGVDEGESSFSIYVVSSKNEKLEEPEYSGTAAGGFSFTVPESFGKEKILAVEILPKDVNGIGRGRFIKYISAPQADNTAMSESLKNTVVFSGGTESDIRENRNGWSIQSGKTEGTDYGITVSEKAGVSNSLGINAVDWWRDTYFTYTPEENGSEPLEGKAYVEFNAMFDAPNYFDKESRMFIALNNGVTDFASVRLMGRRLDIVAMNEAGTYRQFYTIGLGMEELYGKWINFKMYTNGSDSFAVCMNGKFVRNQNGGIWFKCADSACSGPAEASGAKADKIRSVKMGFEWSGKDSTLWINDLKCGTYRESENTKWTITDVGPLDGELIFGERNSISVTAVENTASETGKLYLGLYKDSKLMSVDIIDDVVFDGRGVYEGTAEVEVPRQGGEYTLKCFAWEDGMKPIAGTYSSSVNVESTFVIPNVFSDNMMLQADKPVTVWGEAPDGETVTAVLTNTESGDTVTADGTAENGAFSIDLQAQEAGSVPYTLELRCGEESYVYGNIIFGDIYLLAGQSNMEYWMSGLADTKADLEANKERAENDNIRSVDLLSKGTDGANVPQQDLPEVSGTMWKPMTYGNALYASQIGYYFAQALNEETGRPIGFIGAAVGGTGSDQWVSGGRLYNNRVYPLRNMKLSGILYYQGEADEGKSAEQYSDIMAGIIDDYRALFGDEELPFYYAQLARYSNQNFEKIRAGQFLAMEKAANKTNVGIVSNLDEVGNFGSNGNTTGNARHDIHPYGKAEVARRFTLWAKRDIYGQSDVAAHGPMCISAVLNNGSAVLEFDCTGELSVMPMQQYADYKTESIGIDPDIINGFEVAGADGIFYTADAEISGNKIILTCDEVPEPAEVRYAWGAYPESPNLTDETGLPSYTFAVAISSEDSELLVLEEEEAEETVTKENKEDEPDDTEPDEESAPETEIHDKETEAVIAEMIKETVEDDKAVAETE